MARKKYLDRYRIETMRCPNWDYSNQGSYFITIIIHQRKHLLGKIINKQLQPSTSGQIVAQEIENMETYQDNVTIDEAIIMPDHIHLLITISPTAPNTPHNQTTTPNPLQESKKTKEAKEVKEVKEIHEFPQSKPQPKPQSDPQPNNPPLRQTKLTPAQLENRTKRRKMTISKLIGKLKQQTSKKINLINNTEGKRTWQASYHDHIVRNHDEYHRIKQYIKNNPSKWEEKHKKSKTKHKPQ